MSCRRCRAPQDAFFGFCNSCSQTVGYLEKYPGLQSILSPDSLTLLVGGVSASEKPVLNVGCQRCDRRFDIDLVSLLKQYRRNADVGRDFFYRCHRCSKAGPIGISLDAILPVLDLVATADKFGGLPANVKTGKVVAVCEDCKTSSEVKLSSVLHQARRHRIAGRVCIYKCFKCGVLRPDAIEKSCVARAKQLGDGFRSSLERAMASRLSSLGLAFIPQFEVGLYTWDFFLPEHSVLVDVDGEYWHSSKERIAKDQAKLTYTERYFSQYKAFRIEEKNFLNPKMVDKILQSMTGALPEPEVHDFSLSEVIVSRIGGKGEPVSPYSDFLDAFHYAGSGRAGVSVYGAHVGQTLVGVCKFNSVTRAEVASSRGLMCKQVLELDRFCLHPSYQKKNFASWFISRCINLVFSELPHVLELVSFSDETFGHSGTIYRASNWMMVGRTRPSYHYMDVSGIAINKKRVYDIASKLKMTEAEYVKKHGLERFVEKPKIKFVFLRPTY